jgi:DNA-binding NarL/FixJ family response regulator
VIRVALVDDQELLRTGFRMVLEAQPDMEVVAEAADGLAALEVLAGVPVDVVLMDVRMPRLDGVQATRRLLARDPGIRVLILTTFDLDEYVYAAIRAGVSGFLLKDVPSAELLYGIRAVASGDAIVAPSTTRRLLERFAPRLSESGETDENRETTRGAPAGRARGTRFGSLTDRERGVLELVARGLSNLEIAAELVVAEATVKTHVHRILAKLDLRDRVQAVVLAYEIGLVSPGASPPESDAADRAD